MKKVRQSCCGTRFKRLITFVRMSTIWRDIALWSRVLLESGSVGVGFYGVSEKRWDVESAAEYQSVLTFFCSRWYQTAYSLLPYFLFLGDDSGNYQSQWLFQQCWDILLHTLCVSRTSLCRTWNLTVGTSVITHARTHALSGTASSAVWEVNLYSLPIISQL